MARVKESFTGTLITLLLAAGMLVFLAYMTSGYGGALSIPMYM